MNKITAKVSDRFAKAAISFVLVLLTLFAPLAETASDAGLFGITAYAADSYTYTYYPKPSYKGGSIVDGLKAIGVDSSWANREKIAALNGISNYKSTAAQNTKMLQLLKSGKLVKSKTLKTGQVVRPADGYYVIVSGLSSNKALDVNGCATGYANIQLWSLNYSKAQIYYIEHVSGDWYRIVNVNSGKVIDVEGNSSKSGANICQYSYNGQNNQLWRFRAGTTVTTTSNPVSVNYT